LDTYRLEESGRLVTAASAVERNHGSKSVLLPLRKIMLGMRGQSWIEHTVHRVVMLQKESNGESISVHAG
jgi:hypothetical protein